MSAVSSMPFASRAQMFQKDFQDAFFDMQALAPRPLSASTEIYETDFEEDESDDGEMEDESPRFSTHSAGRRSETTLSSFDDLPTPKSNNFQPFHFDAMARPVEGPKGPHLFRASLDMPANEEYYLTMSPMTPKTPHRPATAFEVPPLPLPTPSHRPISTLTEVLVKLDIKEVARWSPAQVARWMYSAGFEPLIVQKFEENDISGAILVTLKFEDLRELDIPSFGKRHRLWNEIDNLKGRAGGGERPPTVIECESDDDEVHPKKNKKTIRRFKSPGLEDVISPIDSVSIVGIEQLMPKPHKCPKGENCSRYRKQQRLINAFKNEHPLSPMGGSFLVAGNPGNPMTADAARPFSDVVPSVVASSDVLGPGSPPLFRPLEQASLAGLMTRDPQDNVKQFLDFQHINVPYATEQPATPPFEMFPPLQHGQTTQNLRALPKLAIPGPQPPSRSASAMAFSPGPMERVEAISPRLRNARPQNRSPPQVQRFGTPASDMDVPYTSINLGQPSREASQSVPPNMNFRQPIQRSASRSSRRPSFPVMPALVEHAVVASHGKRPSTGSNSFSSTSNTLAQETFSPTGPPRTHNPHDPAHSGWMKKRKTRMLRHEWHEHHFTLTGTRLAMHKDERSPDVLDSIDVDDYAIACSSLASSKLNAAFKAMNILRGNAKDARADEAAFAFQLIPAAIEKGQRLRKRDSMMNAGGATDKTKTHHFAVKSRDERIDWMRELMLAKALKQKGEGFEINVNGNMI